MIFLLNFRLWSITNSYLNFTIFFIWGTSMRVSFLVFWNVVHRRTKEGTAKQRVIRSSLWKLVTLRVLRVKELWWVKCQSTIDIWWIEWIEGLCGGTIKWLFFKSCKREEIWVIHSLIKLLISDSIILVWSLVILLIHWNLSFCGFLFN